MVMMQMSQKHKRHVGGIDIRANHVASDATAAVEQVVLPVGERD
jgi:hypothetical protein